MVALPGTIRPTALGIKTDEIRCVLNVGEPWALIPNWCSRTYGLLSTTSGSIKGVMTDDMTNTV